MKKWRQLIVGLTIGVMISSVFYFGQAWYETYQGFLSPLVMINQYLAPERPWEKYQLENLDQISLVASELTILNELDRTDQYISYVFSYEASGGSISGQLNVPLNFERPRVIIMARGYVPGEIFTTGMGTKNAARVFASQGFITIAPDFLGFGQSSPDVEDSWESRFIKPVQVMELIQNSQKTDFKYLACTFHAATTPNPNSCPRSFQMPTIGLWGHSNGGQVMLAVLEGFKQNYPTTLWAPVTAPFPYSVLFFTDEMADEGKATRVWLSQFERDYDVLEFSLTQHLDRLQGPLQIHHGTADEAALLSWSLEFRDKVLVENQNRKLQAQQIEDAASTSPAPPTASAQPTGQLLVLPEIELKLFTYPGANHNLQPGWETVVARDVEFFGSQL